MTNSEKGIVEREHEHAVLCRGCGEWIRPRIVMTGVLTYKRVATTYDGVCATCAFCDDYDRGEER